MTPADRRDAFDLIQQLRGNLMERDAITPADLTPAARRTHRNAVPTPAVILRRRHRTTRLTN